MAIPLGAVLQYGRTIDHDAPLHRDSLGKGMESLFGFLVLGLQGHRFTDDRFYFG